MISNAIEQFEFDLDTFLLDNFNFSSLYEDKLNIDELKNISDKGNIEAQLKLGNMYKNIEEIKNEKESDILFQRAFHHSFSLAKQDNAEAQYYLSIIYYYGFGRSRDLEKAFKWCKKSSEKGYDESLLFLGVMYEKGEGTKKDELKAIDCYRDLAEKGNIEAQKNLAEIHFRRREYKEAFEWYPKIDKQNFFSVENITKFAEKGYTKAQLRLADMYRKADGVKRDYNKVIYWHSKAGEQGDIESQLRLADMYISIKDYGQSIYWYSKAAELESYEAQFALGDLYRLKKDYNKAIYWLSKLAEQGIYESQFSLGKLYKNIKDYDRAIYWFSKATEQEVDFNEFEPKLAKIQLDEIKEFLNLRDKANKGDLDSQLSIVKLFVKGFGIEAEDYKKVLEWYWDLLGNGNIQVLYNLGLMHEFGLGTEQDLEKALNFYCKAMKQGDNNAKKRFDSIEKILENKKLAENGNIVAQLKLAIMYYRRKDYNQTIYWLSKAENNKNIDVQNMFAEIYDMPIEIHNMLDMLDMLGEIDDVDMSLEIEDLDFDKGKNGNVDTANVLSEIYNMFSRIYSGELLDDEDIFLEIVDLDKAIYWYEKSAELGDKLIQPELGLFYELKGDYSKAIYWYEKSALQGEASAQYNLGLIYKSNKDYEKALFWLEKYAEQYKLAEKQYKEQQYKMMQFKRED